MTIYSSSESETEAAGARLAQMLGRGGVAALSGEVGAGNTAFVRGLAEGLGIAGRVTSPTFAIVNEYDGPIPLFHFDMYRISGEDELFELGWGAYLERGGVVAAEWSGNVTDALPAQTVYVRIEKTGGHTRRIDIDFPGEKP
jgi:tRNA threonylcarbamoyladenosine biosynthesis protein TsaE